MSRSAPIIIALSVAMGFTYVAIQQVYRNSADDPQIRMASAGPRKRAVA